MIDFSAFNQLYINGAEVSSLLLNGIKIWEKPSSSSEDIIPDDELWYTTLNKEILQPYINSLVILSNTYDVEKDKGVIKFQDPLTAIPDGYFAGRGVCNSIQMPDSVKTIGASSFISMQNLKSIRLSNNLETIGDTAFLYDALESIVLPASLKTIGYDAFARNSNLKYIEFLGEEAPSIQISFRKVALYGKVVYPNNPSYVDLLFQGDDLPGYDGSLIKDQFWNVEKLYLDLDNAVEIISNVVTRKNPIIKYNLTVKYVFILSNGSTHIITQNLNNQERDASNFYGEDFISFDFGNYYEIDKTIQEEKFNKTYTINIPLVWEEEAETTLDWGDDDLENQITPDPLTRDYATELVDNMDTSKYSTLKFTKPSESGQFGYYGDGIDGLITLCTYATTEATYASSTSVTGDLNLLTTWKNAGAEVAMCHIDKPIARYGKSFIFAGPKDVNVLGFCVVSSHVAHNTRYNRAILCFEPDGTKTADGRTCVKVSNSNFYDGSPDGYIVAVMYK